MRGRPGVTGSKHGMMLLATWFLSKEATRCPSGPSVFVLSACTGRHRKAWIKQKLIAFIHKGGFRVGAGGDASGGSTKMASKPQKNNAALFPCQVKKDTTGINTWMVYDSKSVKAACCQTGLTPHPIVLQIFFFKVHWKHSLEQRSSKANTEQLVASFQIYNPRKWSETKFQKCFLLQGSVIGASVGELWPQLQGQI